MEDHHVDRLGVDARQRVKLTSTNRSIGLIGLPPGKADRHAQRPTRWPVTPMHSRKDTFLENEPVSDLRWPGGYGEGPAPDPIPNSAVKTLSADGTAS